ncbi:BrnT family toxin, partial [Kingella kingae]|uniref:BrnT family toxin n=1 Tax=Kingella kingae TaxID=504 RepID=UPI00056ED9C3
INLEKHGSSFEETATVFWDENALVIADTEHSDDEERFVLLGMREHLRIMGVVHCERGDNIRIISARRAANNATRQYGR